MPLAALNVAAAVSTVGSLVFQSIGLGHLLNVNHKDRATIVEEARQDLSSALAILNTFQEIIHDDFMAPLVGRYNILDAKLKNMEEDLLLKKGLKQAVKSYISKSDMREAKQTRWKSKVLYRQTRAASDGGIFAELVKNKNLTPGGKPMPSTPHPIPVAGYSMPLHSKEYELINSSTTKFSYPPRARVGSLASIESNPFKDPPGTTPM